MGAAHSIAHSDSGTPEPLLKAQTQTGFDPQQHALVRSGGQHHGEGPQPGAGGQIPGQTLKIQIATQ